MKTTWFFVLIAIANVSMGCSSGGPPPNNTDDGGGVVDAADSGADDVATVHDASPPATDTGSGACPIIGLDVDAGQVSISRQYGYTADCDKCARAKCCDVVTSCFTTDDGGAKCTDLNECSNCADIFTAYGVCLSFQPADQCEQVATDNQPDKAKFDALRACVFGMCSSVCHP
jgi:hypothetical protein